MPSRRCVGWTLIHWVGLGIDFNSQSGLEFVCFYESAFVCGLRFPVHPFFMELLDHFGIAPGQLMPNSWRILVNCMGIWMAATNGGILKVDELVYMYRLKESKEYEYYELVPWERRTRIVKGLPLSFRYCTHLDCVFVE